VTGEAASLVSYAVELKKNARRPSKKSKMAEQQLKKMQDGRAKNVRQSSKKM
jgi:hypothetical protein